MRWRTHLFYFNGLLDIPVNQFKTFHFIQSVWYEIHRVLQECQGFYKSVKPRIDVIPFLSWYQIYIYLQDRLGVRTGLVATLCRPVASCDVPCLHLTYRIHSHRSSGCQPLSVWSWGLLLGSRWLPAAFVSINGFCTSFVTINHLWASLCISASKLWLHTASLLYFYSVFSLCARNVTYRVEFCDPNSSIV